jgi:hypothetical protein
MLQEKIHVISRLIDYYMERRKVRKMPGSDFKSQASAYSATQAGGSVDSSRFMVHRPTSHTVKQFTVHGS